MAMLEVNALAPHFALLGIDGHEYAVPKHTTGTPLLLAFFKTSCATCDLTFPYINRLHQIYPQGWRLWAIAQDPPDKAKDYATRHSMDYPVLIDAPAYAVSKLYDPTATPTLFLVDERGRAVYSTYGFAKDDLNEIARLVAKSLDLEPAIIAPADDGHASFKPG